MELTFNKAGNNWVTEFIVTADFTTPLKKLVDRIREWK